MQKRMDYLDYVAAAPRPGIAVIEDLDDPAGYGAFWGEVQTNVHKALGCLGTITNGSVRDIPQVAEGFQMLAGSIAPSHAYVHVEEFGIPVTIHGMAVKSGDLIHADRHGAVIVPVEYDRRHAEGARWPHQAGSPHHHRGARARRDGRGHQGGVQRLCPALGCQCGRHGPADSAARIAGGREHAFDAYAVRPRVARTS